MNAITSFAIPHNIIGRSDNAGGNGKQYQREVCYTLDSRGKAHAVTICYEAHAQDSRCNAYEEICPTVTKYYGTGGGNVPMIEEGYAVRRLTPVECERLQGFPDGYTEIPFKGKPVEKCPDSLRYKALGNSMAVPCMRWIGERIDEVERMD